MQARVLAPGRCVATRNMCTACGQNFNRGKQEERRLSRHPNLPQQREGTSTAASTAEQQAQTRKRRTV